MGIALKFKNSARDPLGDRGHRTELRHRHVLFDSDHRDVNPSVLGAAFGSGVAGDGHRLAVAVRPNDRRIDTLLDQYFFNTPGALLRQAQVVLFRPGAVGMSIYLDTKVLDILRAGCELPNLLDTVRL